MSLPPSTPDSKRPRKRDGVLFICGIFVFFFGLMMLRMTERAWVFHRNAARYIQTDLEILHLDTSGGDGPSSHHVRVAATGEELTINDIDTRITIKQGPGGIIGKMPARDDAKGMCMPAWYDASARRVAMSDLRVAFRSEYSTLPGIGHAVKVSMVNLFLFIAGFAMTRTGYRRLKKAVRGMGDATATTA